LGGRLDLLPEPLTDRLASLGQVLRDLALGLEGFLGEVEVLVDDGGRVDGPERRRSRFG
jgi:hypothetical protein